MARRSGWRKLCSRSLHRMPRLTASSNPHELAPKLTSGQRGGQMADIERKRIIAVVHNQQRLRSLMSDIVRPGDTQAMSGCKQRRICCLVRRPGHDRLIGAVDILEGAESTLDIDAQGGHRELAPTQHRVRPHSSLGYKPLAGMAGLASC